MNLMLDESYYSLIFRTIRFIGIGFVISLILITCLVFAVKLIKGIIIPKLQILYLIILSFYSLIVLWITIYNRGRGSRKTIHLIPFQSLVSDTGGIDYGTLFMELANVALFVPLGVLLYGLLTNLLKDKTRLICFATVILATVIIECFQFLTGRGYFEVEDIILNTIGGLIGILIMQFETDI